LRSTALLLLRLLHRDEYALLLEHVGELTALVHGDEDVAAANELLIDVELGDSRPIRELLDACFPHATPLVLRIRLLRAKGEGTTHPAAPLRPQER